MSRSSAAATVVSRFRARTFAASVVLFCHSRVARYPNQNIDAVAVTRHSASSVVPPLRALKVRITVSSPEELALAIIPGRAWMQRNRRQRPAVRIDFRRDRVSLGQFRYRCVQRARQIEHETFRQILAADQQDVRADRGDFSALPGISSCRYDDGPQEER